MIEGSGVLFGDSSSYQLEERDIFIINPDEKHVYTTSNISGMKHYTVNFYLLNMESYRKLDREGFWQLPMDIGRLERDAERIRMDQLFDFKVQDVFVLYDKVKWKDILLGIENFSTIMERMNRMPFYLLNADSRYKLDFTNYYSRFFYEFQYVISESGTDDKGLQEDKKHILFNRIIEHLYAYLYKPFNLSDLAGSLNYSPVYICTYFKRHAGMTITQFINKLKIDKACEYLRQTDRSVTDIADILNFSSSNHFSNNFKKEKGISPRDFRKSLERL